MDEKLRVCWELELRRAGWSALQVTAARDISERDGRSWRVRFGSWGIRRAVVREEGEFGG